MLSFHSKIYPFWLCGITSRRSAPTTWPEEWAYFFNQGREYRKHHGSSALHRVNGWLHYFSHYHRHIDRPKFCGCMVLGERCRSGKLGPKNLRDF